MPLVLCGSMFCRNRSAIRDKKSEHMHMSANDARVWLIPGTRPLTEAMALRRESFDMFGWTLPGDGDGPTRVVLLLAGCKGLAVLPVMVMMLCFDESRMPPLPLACR